MDYSSFKTAVYCFLDATNQDAYLLDLRSSEPALAETLLLYKRLLKENFNQEEMFQSAYSYLVINTDNSVPKKSHEHEPLNIEEWIEKYALPLGVTLGKAEQRPYVPNFLIRSQLPERYELKGGSGTKSIFNWPGEERNLSSVEQLREVGKKVNDFRYEMDKVLLSNIFKFEFEQSTYSFAKALRFAHFSELAYYEPEYVEAQLKYWGLGEKAFHWIEDKTWDTQAFVAIFPDYVVLCFRGTSNLKDLVQDLKFVRTPSEDFEGEIHNGFNEAFQYVKKDILEIMLANGKDRRVYVMGHSLGGALAQLFAYKLAEEGFLSVNGIYLYGSPLVGDAVFANAFNHFWADRTYLHINNKDLIARIPPMLLGYKEVGLPENQIIFGKSYELIGDKKQEFRLPPLKINRGEVIKMFDEVQQFIKDGKLRPEHINNALGDMTNDLSKGKQQESEGPSGEKTRFVRPINDHSLFQYSYKISRQLIDSLWEKVKNKQS